MRPENTIQSMSVYAANSSYKQAPTPAQTAAGVVPLDTLPADWWNRLLYDITSDFNNAAVSVQAIYDEILTVLARANITPNPTQTDQLYNAIEKVRRTIATGTVPGSVISSTLSGKVQVDQAGVMTVTGLGTPTLLNTTSRDVVGAINEILATLTTYISTNDSAVAGKAPTNHAATATTYGKGDSSNYGHVKLSDATNSTSGVDGGIAATPAAVKAAYDEAQSRGSSTNPVTRAETADKWTTARNFTIKDSDSSNTGTSVSVDGSNSVDLKLPSTIKATLNGSASSADKWTTARDIKIQDSDGSNTGSAISVDGSADKTLKLPSTIKASIDGTASNASALESNTYRQTALQGLYITTNTESLTESTYTFSPSNPSGSTDLAAGSTVRITFRYALQSNTDVTAVSLDYGGRTGVIKAAKAGSLKAVESHYFRAGNYSSSYPYKVWDAWTTLELMWTGTEWLVLGKPIVCSYSADGSAGYIVYADGYIGQWQRYAPSSATRNFYINFKETPIVLSNYNNNNVSRTYSPIAHYVSTSQYALRSESNYSSGDRFCMYATGY